MWSGKGVFKDSLHAQGKPLPAGSFGWLSLDILKGLEVAHWKVHCSCGTVRRSLQLVRPLGRYLLRAMLSRLVTWKT